MTSKFPPIILITGATCSGKSSLAVEVAKELNAEIVSIDSVQVYKDFNIGSAKITEKEMEGVPHHLLDLWLPNNHFDVAKYLSLADKAIEDIRKRGKNVVIAGGTTMYVTSLIHGLAEIPESNISLRKELEQKNIKELFSLLVSLDKEASEKINENDKTRIIRALEVVLSSGKSVLSFQNEHKFLKRKYDCIGYAVCLTREELYKKINLRTKEMIDMGLIEEAKNLLKKYDKNLLPFSSIGYKQVIDFLDKKLSKEEMIEDIAKKTRHLAKRQMTYLRNEPIKRGWNVFPKDDDKEATLLESDNSTLVGKGVIKDFYVYNYNVKNLISDIKEKIEKCVEEVNFSYIRILKDKNNDKKSTRF